MSVTNTSGQELFDVPFGAGESPFKVKGIAYKGHLDYTERYVPGGVRAMVAELDDDAQTRFFDQPFLAASMYDVFPLAQAGVACSNLTRLSFPQFVRIRSRVQAEADIKGVYKFLMNLVSAEAIAQRIPKIMGQYFGFLETEVTEVEKNRVVGLQHGVPRPLAGWLALVGAAYLDTALKLAGTTAPNTVAELETAGGTAHGVSLCTIRFTVTWR
jgi:hypothetical protein